MLARRCFTSYFEVGTEASPFPYPASITLYGNRTSPTLVVDNSYFLGNKVMAVFGNVSFVAATPAVLWSKLAATAVSGADTLVLVDAVDWPVGATVVVTPTEYDNRQAETVTITAVTRTAGGNGTTSITVTPPLQFRHAGETVAGQRLSAAVGLIDRGITFAGDNAEGGYGAHVVVGQITVDQDVFPGIVHFRGVAFNGVGQLGSEYPALHFIVPSPAPSRSGRVWPVSSTRARLRRGTTRRRWKTSPACRSHGTWWRGRIAQRLTSTQGAPA